MSSKTYYYRKHDGQGLRNTSLTVELEWPPSALMPNRSSGHAWQWSHAEKTTVKQAAYLLTRQAITRTPYAPDRAPTQMWRLTFTFHSPDGRSRNLDSLHMAMKSAIDGIAEAFGVDDERFVEHTQRWGAMVNGGRVVVELVELTPDEARAARHANITRKAMAQP